MKSNSYRAALVAGIATMAMCAPAMVRAQAASPGSAADEASSGLEEIVVTARKRTENLRDVPVSITALGGQRLVETKITQVTELAARVPNLTVSAGANLPFALIRGFGSGNNLSFDQAVGKFIDNVSYGRDQDVRLPLFDVERVEVLKGPQVLLYGNSSTAGALNITSRKPGDSFAADGSLAYEFESNEVVAQGGVTAPMGDKASLRVAGLYQDLAHGRVFNTLTGDHGPTTRNYAGRATLLLKPVDDLRVTLKAEYHHLRDRGDAGEVMSPSIFSFLPLPDTKLDGKTAIDNSGAPFFAKSFNAVNSQTYQGDIAYDLAGGTLSSTTAYRNLKFASQTPSPAPVPVLNAFLDYRYKQISEELRYSGSFGKLDLTMGGYYQHDTLKVYSAIDFNLTPTLPPGLVLPPFSLNGVFDQTANSYSLFADATYHLTDALSIEAGARYTSVRKRADQSLVAGNVVPGKTFGTGAGAISPNDAFTPLFIFGNGVAPHAYTGLKLKDEAFQPQVVLQYKVAPRNQVYAKYVKGEKAGGFDYFYTGTPPGPTPGGARFRPEQATSFELGFKGVTEDNRLDFSIAAFRTTFNDLQASSFQVASFVVTNVGKARTEGVELELNYAPAEGLRIGGSVAWLKARYLDYPGQPCTVAQKVAFGGEAGCSQDLSGAPTQFSSKWTGTLTVDYDQPIGNGMLLGGGVAVFARSHYNASTNDEPLQEQKGYAQIDAQLRLKAEDGRWSAGLFARNLTDKKLLDFGATAPALGAALTGFQSRGRQLGVRFGFDFR